MTKQREESRIASRVKGKIFLQQIQKIKLNESSSLKNYHKTFSPDNSYQPSGQMK